MVCDFISQYAQGQYNRKLARLIGLKPAIYFSELANIVLFVVKKGKFDKTTGAWEINRKYVEEQTTLTVEEQLECDQILTKFGIILPVTGTKKQNKIIINLQQAEDLIVGRIQVTPEISPISNLGKKQSKEEFIISMLKSSISEPDPELAEAYCNWIDVVYSKGVCKKVQVQSFVDDVNRFATSKSQKLELINTCMKAGYKLAEWGVKSGTTQISISAGKLPEQKISNGSVSFTDEFR